MSNSKRNENVNVNPVAASWDPVALMTDYVHKYEDAKNSEKPLKYIMGEDGQVYEMRSTDLGDFVVKAEKVNGADTIKEGFSLNTPKIPFKLLLQAVSFFRDVCDEFNNDEAMLQYWYDKNTKEFTAECLEQTTNKVHVTYIRKQELEEDPNKILVMDIHSHNTMNAFFSATDDASEQETRTYGVIGKLDQDIPEYKFRISVEGEFREIPISSIFEMPKVKLYAEGFETESDLDEENIFFPDVEYPKEWLDIIEEGKKNKQRFSGKGNVRSTGSNFRGSVPKPKSDTALPSLGSLVDDPYSNVSQMSIFDKWGYQQDALSNREGFGIEDNSIEYVDEYSQVNDFMSEEDYESFADVLVDQVEALESDPDKKVELLTRMISNFTMFEIKMLVDRMLEIGFDNEIVDQLKEYGYKVSDK